MVLAIRIFLGRLNKETYQAGFGLNILIFLDLAQNYLST